MAKDKTILIEFDMPITGAAGNENAFAVTGNEYKYVGGPLLVKTYPVSSTQVPLPPQNIAKVTQSILDAGTYQNTVASSGKLTLGGVTDG